MKMCIKFMLLAKSSVLTVFYGPNLTELSYFHGVKVSKRKVTF